MNEPDHTDIDAKGMEPISPLRRHPDVHIAVTPASGGTCSISPALERDQVEADRRADHRIDQRVEVEIITRSFDEFYRSERSSVARALAVTLRDTDLASDAVDEAMARAYQRWAHVASLDNPAGWVYRVALNWSRSFLRRARRAAPSWVSGTGVSPAAASTDPTVDLALAELSIDHRAVVVCRLLIGYSELQTADALGIRPGTVKSRLSRATAQLRSSLGALAPHASEEDFA